MKANGAEDYFWDTELDQNMLVKLGSKRVPYHIIIAAATVTSKECEYSKELLGNAAIEWEEKVIKTLDKWTNSRAHPLGSRRS